MNIIQHPSPNFNERKAGVPFRYIVLHYTGMPTAAEALERLCDPKGEPSPVSAHYVIEEDGRVFQLVDERKRAWHAGASKWFDVTDMNSASIGIELVNPGHSLGYHPFPKAQIAAGIELLHGIVERHKFNARTCLLAHADIAPTRKEDPGELFPWRELAGEGLGRWPQPRPDDYGHAEDDEVQNLLRANGYDCPNNGAYDRLTRAALLAFQRHYEPDNLTGTPERETIARLRVLARELRQ